MSLSSNNNFAPNARVKGPARDFAAFSETERDHRRNADPNFDAALYDEAVQLVLDRLGAFRKETQQ
jgi:hypothetical protein